MSGTDQVVSGRSVDNIIPALAETGEASVHLAYVFLLLVLVMFEFAQVIVQGAFKVVLFPNEIFATLASVTFAVILASLGTVNVFEIFNNVSSPKVPTKSYSMIHRSEHFLGCV